MTRQDDPDRLWLVRVWTFAGHSAEQIGERLGVTARHVARLRKKAGCLQKRTWEPMTEQELAQAHEMLKDGCSYHEVAKTLGRAHDTIQRKCPGYPCLTNHEAAQIAQMMKRLNRIGKA